MAPFSIILVGEFCVTIYNEFSFAMRHYIPKNANFPPLTMLQGIFLKSVLFFFRQIFRQILR